MLTKCFLIISALIIVAVNAFDPMCAVVDNGDRFDCYPEPGSNQAGCLSRNCCWQLPEFGNGELSTDVPYCYFPSNFPTYRVLNSSLLREGGIVYSIQKSAQTFRQNEILNLEVRIIPETRQRLRVQIVDPANDRYQVPVIKRQNSSSSYSKNEFHKEFVSDEYDYQTFVSNDPFSIKVFRKSTGKLM